jgi:hypothetical protein
VKIKVEQIKAEWNRLREEAKVDLNRRREDAELREEIRDLFSLLSAAQEPPELRPSETVHKGSLEPLRTKCKMVEPSSESAPRDNVGSSFSAASGAEIISESEGIAASPAVARDAFFQAGPTVLLVSVAALCLYLTASPGPPARPLILLVLAASFGTLLIHRFRALKREPYKRAAVQWAVDEPRRFITEQFKHVSNFRLLAPRDFEDAIAELYRGLGYSAVRTPFSGDGGWDVSAIRNDERLLIECKHYGEGKVVGRPMLQKLHSAVITEGATRGVLVTTRTFSAPAYAFAEEVGLQLIDETGLAALVRTTYGREEQPLMAQGMCTKCASLANFDMRTDRLHERCPNGHDVECPIPAAIKIMEFGPSEVLSHVAGRGGRRMPPFLRQTITMIAALRLAEEPRSDGLVRD